MLAMSCGSSLGLHRSWASFQLRPSIARAVCRFSTPTTSNFGAVNSRWKRKRSTWQVADSSQGNSNACSSGDEDESPSSVSCSAGPPQEAVLKVISEVSKTEGRVAQTLNVVMGGTVTGESDDEWKTLDQKVNTYPTVRGFTAIGTGGEDFVQAMVGAVESVLQSPIPEGRVKHRLSSQGKYVSVKIGPVTVVSSDQVQAVYNAMRRDVRMKYFL
eukprot:TRINITY_DN3861_c0_g1_i1.p1 TRINITY_DN3861_c0_g1~~TRINITY_DN3861_c0_g1_i1.p1  ORF type:complete len:215 (-),score=43.05 TRINITY_DN3861_c0_g1_i1:600-1244(-)